MKEFIKECKQEYYTKVKKYILDHLNSYFVSNEHISDINSALYCTSCYTHGIMFSKIIKWDNEKFILRIVDWQYFHDRDITNSPYNRFVGTNDRYYRFRVKNWIGYTINSAIDREILYDIPANTPSYIKILLDSNIEMEGMHEIHITDDEIENEKRCLERVNEVIKKYSKI